MEYMGNEKYWDDKFSSRGDNLLGAEKAIVENLVYLKKGSVLDIACGEPSATINIYLAHLLTFLFYGLTFDLIKRRIKNRKLNK